MTAPRAGDRVRVAFEATYRCRHDMGRHQIRLDGGDFWTLPMGIDVEVIKRSVRVGDILDPSVDDYPGIGYVVRSVAKPLSVYHLGTHLGLDGWPYLRGSLRVIDVPQDQS